MSFTGLKTLPLIAGTVAAASPWQGLFARSGLRVYPFQLGAMVRTTSTGTTVSLYGLGQVAASDYVMFCDATAYGGANMFVPNISKIKLVSAVSSSDDQITLSTAVSITAGDYMMVLGVDTAPTTPALDGSTVSLYTDNAGINAAAASSKYMSTTTGGAFIGWVGAGTKAVDVLVTNSSGTPQIVQPFVAMLPTTEVNQIRTMTAGGATPAVGGFKVLKLGQSGAVSVTNFTGATAGDTLTVIATDGNSTLVHNASVMRLAGAANKVLATNDVIQLLNDGSIWRQIAAQVVA